LLTQNPPDKIGMLYQLSYGILYPKNRDKPLSFFGSAKIREKGILPNFKKTMFFLFRKISAANSFISIR